MENGKWNRAQILPSGYDGPTVLRRAPCPKSRNLRVRSLQFTGDIVRLCRAHLFQESNELIAVLTASIRTSKSNPHRGERRTVEDDADGDDDMENG